MGEVVQAVITQSGGGLGLMTSLPMLVGVFFIWWFLVIRPQRRQQEDHKTLLSSLKRGDEVVLSGGMYGRIHAVSEKTVTVDIADRTRVKFMKSAVSARAQADAAKGKDDAEAAADDKDSATDDTQVAVPGKKGRKKKEAAS